MKIYTKTGDEGKTSLIGGHRVSKDNLRLEAYGTVDELSSFIGVLINRLVEQEDIDFLLSIQNDLFMLGAALATVGKTDCKVSAEKIETEIDKIQSSLPELHCFILPRGCEGAVFSHVCRTVCRRAERRIVTLSENFEINAEILQYFNRLSDYFFVLSRKCNKNAEINEKNWEKSCK